MIHATCDFKHKFMIPKEREGEQSHNCPECGLLTFNPARPKRTKIDFGVGAVVSDSDHWNPFCAGMGELDAKKKAARMADGSIRLNPKTGNYEGYYDTRAKYRQALKDHGVINSHGEGEINEARQGWNPNLQDKR